MTDPTTARVRAWVEKHTGPLRPLRLLRCVACAFPLETHQRRSQFHVPRCPRHKALCLFTLCQQEETNHG